MESTYCCCFLVRGGQSEAQQSNAVGDLLCIECLELDIFSPGPCRTGPCLFPFVVHPHGKTGPNSSGAAWRTRDVWWTMTNSRLLQMLVTINYGRLDAPREPTRRHASVSCGDWDACIWTQ